MAIAAPALLSAAFGTAATAATTTAAASAATAGLFGTAGAFSFMTTASTLGTAFSIGSLVMGGSEEKKNAKAQQQYSELQARQEITKGQQEATNIKEQLAAAMSTAVARGAGSGIDITSGSPANAVAQAQRDAENAYSLSKSNSKIAASTAMQNGRMTAARGVNAERSARTQAVGIASSYAGKLSDRGFSF